MNLYFGESLKILTKTTPYLLLRLLVYGGIGLGSGVFLGIFWALSKVFGGIGGLIFIISILGLFGILRLIREYVLYMIKAGHIAVVTHLIRHGQLPPGVNQIEFGKNAVTSMFKEISVLFAIDQMVEGVLKAFNRIVVRIADFLPIPGLDSVAKLFNYVSNFALTYVDESILSYNFSRKDENIWESSKRGIVLYAQNWKPVMKSAVFIAIANVVGLVICILLFMIPLGIPALAIKNETAKFLLFILSITLGFALKLAIVNPFTMISMILTYNHSIQGQEPNYEWESKLEGISDKFRDLKTKASEAFRSPPLPTPSTLTESNGTSEP